MKDRRILVVIILFLLITLLGLALRLYRLDAQSLWYDEGFSVYLAGMDLAEITERTAADIQPPLYYFLLHGWINLFGDGELAVRGLSVLFGVLTIPMVYAVAWQLFRNWLAGLLAALLLAVSPLHIWYSQEVRMYTMLTFLCLLSSYLLLLIVSRSLQAPEPEVGRAAGGERGGGLDWAVVGLWVAYTLTSIAALYTHYFTFFILVFQGIYLLWVAIGAALASPAETSEVQGRRAVTLVAAGIVSGVAMIVAYLPWLPHLVTRLGADVSYWPGRLKIHEVLIDIAIFFVGGESVSEPVGILLSLGYGMVVLLCFVSLLFSVRSKVQRPIAFLVLYLLLPPALILILSYTSPKFNARYAMVAHPALLLIVAGGLAALWKRRSGTLGNLVRGVAVALCLVFLLGVSAYANYNAYTDPAFARADFRGVAKYLSKHAEPDEAIILSSGHMFPVFDYYAPDVERYLLPDSPTLDTTRTLDYSIAADLIDWLAGREGVWLVLWQDEVVDPAGYLTGILDEVGEEQPVSRTFPQVDVRHYRLPPDTQFPERPQIDHPVDYNFGNQLRLLGYSQTGQQEVTLFWEALKPLEEDYRVSLTLRDTAGQVWGKWDGRPTAYLFPTDRWREGQIVPGHHELELVPGAPPGDYGLEVGVYTEQDPVGLDVLDQAGSPQGKRAMLGAVQLSVPATTADEIKAPNPTQIEMGGGLSLIGWDLDRTEAQPGDQLALTLVWAVDSQPQGDFAVRLFVVDSEGQILDAGAFLPTNAWHPTSGWLPGQAWRGQNSVRLPIQAAAGEGHITVQLMDASGTPVGSPAHLTTIEVLTTSRVFNPPQVQMPRQANFDAKMLLLGADLGPDPVAPGGVLGVTLHWQALTEMDIPYTVFVHLLDAEERLIEGHDGEPAGGTRPTTGWVPGEYIADPHEIQIPANLAPGEYVVEVGVYDAGVTSLPRLPVLGEDGQVETDRVIFGPVSVR